MCLIMQLVLLRQTFTIWYIQTKASDVTLKDEIKDIEVYNINIKEVDIASDEYPGIKGET